MAVGLKPGPRPDRIPLSRPQRLFFPDEAGRAAFHRVPTFREILGPLDADVLAEALQRLVDRTEILRTRYLSDRTDAWQEVLGHVAAPLEIFDYRPRPAADAGQVADDRIEAAWRADRPAFSSGVNLKARLALFGGDRARLYLWVNHVACDAGSMALLVRALFGHYDAIAAGDAEPAPDAAPQYADFAVLDAGRASLPIPGALPLDGFAPAAPDWPGDEDSEPTPLEGRLLLLDDDPWARLKAVARDRQATPALALLTLSALMLSRLAGERRIRLANVVSRRPPGAETLIGCFTRVFSLGLDLSGEPSFEEALARTRAAWLEAYRRDAPVDGDAFAGATAPRVIVNFRNEPPSFLQTRAGLLVGGAQVSFEGPAPRGPVPLVISFQDRGPHLVGGLGFKPFDRRLAHSFADIFARFADAVGRAPDQPAFGQLILEGASASR